MTTFTLWTKRKNIVTRVLRNRAKPKNLILIYSNPYIDKLDVKLPKHFDKVFNNVDKDTLKERQNCTGQQCITCRRCYIKSNDNTIIEAVKTNGRPKNLPKITVIKKANNKKQKAIQYEKNKK